MTAHQLRSVLDNRNDFRVIDCSPGGVAGYCRGHVPGSKLLPVSPDLKDGTTDLDMIRFDKFYETLGICDVALGKHHIIVYDDIGSLQASRFWWVARRYGIENVSILDGGWQMWCSEGLSVETNPPVYSNPKTYNSSSANRKILAALKENSKYVATIEDVHDASSDIKTKTIIDTRSYAEYVGEKQINRTSGHVPGAIWLEWKSLLKPSSNGVSVFLSKEEIKALAAERGIDEGSKDIIIYCQRAIRAAHAAFALELAGFSPKVYEGSMKEYQNS